MIDDIMEEYERLSEIRHRWEVDQITVDFSSPEPTDKVVEEKPPEPIKPKRIHIRVDTLHDAVKGPDGHMFWFRDGEWVLMFWTLVVMRPCPDEEWTGSERGWDWIS